MNTRMDRSRLNIGTYFLAPYACDDAHVRDVADCGIDFIVCMQNDRAALDLLARHGVGAVVTGVLPAWWGGDGDRAGKLEATHPSAEYSAAAAAFRDHPAVWGIDTGDEPSALDFPYYGQVIKQVEHEFPAQFAYLNLYPNYASVAQNSADQRVNQLGVPTYAEYIEHYCSHVPTDYICYDYYMYSSSVQGAYDNLRIVSDACRRTGRSLWIVLQVNSNREEEWISLGRLRFQAYSALAFGAETIIWACWTAGWWHNQVLDAEGRKTQQYDKLRAANAELHTLGERYSRYRCTSTLFAGKKAAQTGHFGAVSAADGSDLIVGELTARKGTGDALLLCCAADPMDAAPGTVAVQLDSKVPLRALADGRELLLQPEDGVCRLSLSTCGGALVERA